MLNQSRALNVARAAAVEAGGILKAHFLKLKPEEVTYKGRLNPVTVADTEAEALILKHIQKAFPDHDILAEETGLHDLSSKEYLWVVDPLDGTTNFALGNPLFSVSIALYHRTEAILSVVHLPTTGQTFSAQKGRGAHLNGQRLQVSEEKALKESAIAYCFPPEPEGMKSIAQLFPRLVVKTPILRQFGVASWELCQIAAGKLNGFFMTQVHPWDVAGGALMVTEAGGKATDLEGHPWKLEDKFLLATNGKLHPELLPLLT